MLHKKFVIKNSPMQGRGLFSAERIKKGERVLTFEGPVLSDTQVRVLGHEDHVVPIGIDEYIDVSEPESLVNHSCEPNTGFLTATTLVAVDNIEPGEEITFDYSLVTMDGWKMLCLCGTKNCRITIGDFKDLPKDIQEKYKNITPQWMLELKNQKN